MTISKFSVSALWALLAIHVASPALAVSSAEFYGTTSSRYGRFEARVQFPPGDGVVGSFFLWKSGSEMPQIYWNELDFEKVEETCELHLNNLYGLPEASHSSAVEGLTGLCTSYHHYGFEWTPTYIAWFVDGIEVRRDVGDAVQVYADNATEGMIFDFNNWPGTVAFGGEFSPDILPVHQYISYVQYSEYTPGVGEGGSDFTFAWRESFDDGTFPSGWGRGTWDSPLGQSTHVPANVNIVDGVLVLSLTADDETGFSGTPPTDPGDLPNAVAGGPGTGGTTGSAGGGDSGGAVTGVGGMEAGMGGSQDGAPTADASGCSCRSGSGSHGSRSAGGALIATALGLVAWMARRRRWSA